jgi:hypothetical protein
MSIQLNNQKSAIIGIALALTLAAGITTIVVQQHTAFAIKIIDKASPHLTAALKKITDAASPDLAALAKKIVDKATPNLTG